MEIHIPSLLLYLVGAAIHLIFCLLPAKSGRAVTKCFMMPLLLAFYILTASTVSWLVVTAVLMGWLGDVFLIFARKKICFFIGLGAFLSGHAAYTVEFVRRTTLTVSPGPSIFLLFALLVMAGILAYLSLRKHMENDLIPPAIAYLAIIVCMAGSASLYAFQEPAIMQPSMLVFPGALLFMLSDYVLARGMFIGETRYGAFFVMLTYLSAQFLIVLGLC